MVQLIDALASAAKDPACALLCNRVAVPSKVEEADR